MKAVVQRVLEASVTVNGERVSQVGPGLLVLLGVGKGDTEADVTWMAEKLATLRIFEDAAGKIVVVNRTLSRAEALAARVGGTARPFEELLSLLATTDVVVSGTSSPVPLFTRENMAAALEARAHRCLVMVDLAVPHDIDPEVGELAGVRVHDVDDIQRFMAGNVAARAEEARKADGLVAEEVTRFVRDRTVRAGVPVLARLRQRAEAIARAEVDRTLASLGEELSDKHRKSVEATARAIVNKLLHEPTAQLRSVGTAHEDAHLARTAAVLFGLASP